MPPVVPGIEGMVGILKLLKNNTQELLEYLELFLELKVFLEC